ncbi:hypothetical protein M6D93_04770 [Jatrophihabitans telluris]|uniref:Uncharacterized protein n=1 Tax=Jatrophihabitans telluris TaxID=2038343 RepID=A0ABY4R0T4_9ACTN|nr:hypothetical protein [Jatrophihabitans telluris]UQX89320.1 hypothetical protein M6D93_04770 [Jatrophihabitans telluris]
MFTTLMHSELAAARQRDLLDAARQQHLATEARRAQRSRRVAGAGRRVIRTAVRSVIQPARA